MAHSVKISGYAAIPAILAVAGAAYVMKPSELHRDPILELQGMAGLSAKYEVMYAHCSDGTDKAALDAAGLAKGFVGGYAHHFPARGDEDAIRFANNARPECDVASLYRLERRLGAGSRFHRYRRTRIEI